MNHLDASGCTPARRWAVRVFTIEDPLVHPGRLPAVRADSLEPLPGRLTLPLASAGLASVQQRAACGRTPHRPDAGLVLPSYDQAAITVGQGISGIPERLLLIEVQGWFVALGWLGYRRATPPSR